MIQAIRTAEKECSAEFRIHIENRCRNQVLDRAVEIFNRLHMHQTRDRNGVLIYLAIKDHRSAIIGDVNVNKYVEKEFWQECHRGMTGYFSEGRYTDGICHAIECLQTELRTHFPWTKEDVNELPDDISFGD